MVAGLAALGAGGGSGLDSFNTQYDAATKQLGEMAFGRTLQMLGAGGQPQMGGPPMGGGMPPQGPPMGGQPPMPGAAPQGPPPMGPQGGPPPMQRPGGPPMGGAPGGGMPPPGGPPGMSPPGGGGMPPQGQMGGGAPGGGQPTLHWQQIMEKVSQANPGLPPNALAAAVDRFMPLMSQQSQQQWREMQLYMREQANREREAHNVTMEEQGQQRIGQATERLEKDKAGLEERKREFNIREKRLEANSQVRADQGWQRLEMQRQQLEQRVKEGKDKSAITQWRAIIEAQHKRATEIIQAYSVNSGLDDKQKKQMVEEADKMRDDAIKGIRASTGSSTPTGGTTEKAGPKVEGQAPKGQMDPTAKEGQTKIDREAAKKAGYTDAEVDAFEKGK